MSPTQRTLAALRDAGWITGVVEYWQPSHAARAVIDAASKQGATLEEIQEKVAALDRYGPGKRQDLYDFVDVVAVGLGRTKFVQCCAYSGISSRVTKIVTYCREAAEASLRSRCEIEVWGWKKYSKPVDRKYWRPVIRRLRLASNGGISVETKEAPNKQASQEKQEDLPW